MGAITDLSDLINRITGGGSASPERLGVFIDDRVGSAAATAASAGRWYSFWLNNKSRGGAGTGPGTTPVAPDRTTVGSLMQTNAASGKEKWLLGIEGWLAAAGTLMLYDRLLHQSGLSGTVTTAQTVGGTLTRNTGGEGNEIFVEIYTTIGVTSRTITASYTNQAGTAGRTTPAVPIGNSNLREAQKMIRLPLQDGDTGVRSVQSVTLSASTGTAGDFGVTIARPLMTAFCPAVNYPVSRDLMSGTPGFAAIDDDACLAFALFSASAVAPSAYLGFQFVDA